jgi:hypothetical protein
MRTNPETLKQVIARHVQAVNARKKAIAERNATEAHFWAGYYTAIEALLPALGLSHLTTLQEYQDAARQTTLF